MAGPVVAAAVVLKKFSFKEKIDDSKKLTPQQRGRAYNEIFKNARVGIGIISHKDIDRLNISNATMSAMEQAVSNLGIAVDYVIVDGIKQPNIDCEVKTVIKADNKSISCACASIIAKVTRDNIMNEFDKVFPRYGFVRHKGYGTQRHLAVLKKIGSSPIHRKTFNPVSDYIDI